MRVILEQGDKPEFKSLIYCLQKCGLGFVIVEEETKQVHRLLSDNEFRAAICQVLPFFTVGTQWVAIRWETDCHFFSFTVSQFHSFTTFLK